MSLFHFGKKKEEEKKPLPVPAIAAALQVKSAKLQVIAALKQKTVFAVSRC